MRYIEIKDPNMAPIVKEPIRNPFTKGVLVTEPNTLLKVVGLNADM